MHKLVLFLVLICVGLAIQAENLVKNSSFEEGLKHWRSDPYLPGKVVEEQFSEGNKSLLIEAVASPQMIAAIQHIPNVKSRIYKVEVDLFIESFTAGKFHPIYFQIGTEKGTKYTSRTLEPEKVTPGKQHYELMLDLTPYKKVMLAAFILASENFTGKIYADHFRITPYEANSPTLTIPHGGGVTLNNFVDSVTSKAAINPSGVTVRHDNTSLFFSCRLEALSLNPVFNRLDSFVAGKPGRGSCYALWRNDSIRISLRNPQGVAYFMAVNAAGGYALERELPERWDGNWTPEGFKVSAQKANGFWTAEIEIPLKSLAFDKVDKWKINLVRFDSETGNIFVLARSTDLWKDFSLAPEITLSEKNFIVTPVEIADIMMASRSIPSIASSWEIVNFMKNNPVRVASGAGKSIPLGAAGIGDAFMLTFMDFAGNVLLRTGKIPDRSDSMMGAFEPSEFTSFKIDELEVVSDGKFRLSPGVNKLSFVAKNPDFVNIRIGKKEISVLGTELRVLREVTTLLPLRPDGVWHLSEGGVYALAWPSGAYVSGKIPPEELNDFSLVVDWPETLDLAVPKLKSPKAVEVTREDLPAAPGRRKARLKMNSPVKLAGVPQNFTEEMKKKYEGCWLLFKALGKPGEYGEIIVHAEAEKASFIEIPNVIAFDIAPKLSTPKLKILLFYGLFIRVPEFVDEEFCTEMLRNYADAGFTNLTTTLKETGRALGLRQSSLFYQVNLKKYFPPEFFQENSDFAKDFSNPARYSRTPGMREALLSTWKAYKKANPLEDLTIVDYEYNPFGQRYSCRNPFGIAEFAKKYALVQVPEWSEIEKNYRTQWIEFACFEVGEMLKMLSETAAASGLPTMFYSGYQSEFTQEHYSIDWSKIGGTFNIYAVGYGFNPLLIEATRSAIGGKNLMLGLLQTGNSAATHSAATMLRYLTGGRAGLLLWYEIYNDAAVFLNVAECIKTVAPYEDFITKGKRSDSIIECKNELRNSLAVFTLNGKNVVFLFNESVKPLDISFSFGEKKHSFTLASGSIKAFFLE
ncbi:MAG: hypothetical protein WCT05_07665 [Lentisphaeria bacterium]